MVDSLNRRSLCFGSFDSEPEVEKSNEFDDLSIIINIIIIFSSSSSSSKYVDDEKWGDEKFW